MNCKNCGAPISDSDTRCTYCGTTFDNSKIIEIRSGYRNEIVARINDSSLLTVRRHIQNELGKN